MSHFVWSSRLFGSTCAAVQSQVASDARAGQRHQQVNIERIDLDDSIGSPGKKRFAVRAPGSTKHGPVVSGY